jgi:hypothetical protein
VSQNPSLGLGVLIVSVAIASSIARADSDSDVSRQVIFSPGSNAVTGSFTRSSDKPTVKMPVAKRASVDWTKFPPGVWQASDGTNHETKLSAIRRASSQTGNHAGYFSFRTEKLWKNVEPLGSGCTEQNSDDECNNGSALRAHGRSISPSGGALGIRKPYIGLSLTKPID